MSQAVRQVLVGSLMAYCSLKEIEAEKFLECLKTEGRYVEEVFGGHS
jgi:sulfite reductase alpha subunit-like flavoprotein